MLTCDRRRTSSLAAAGLTAALLCLFQSLALAIDPHEIPRSDLFPLPEAIRENVDFWIKVYTTWHSDQLIAHDSEHPLVVYEVLDLQEELGTDRINQSTLRRYARYLRRKYSGLLRRAASRPVSQMTEEERRLLKLWEPYGGRKAMMAAAERVRIQRGNRNHFLWGLKHSGRYIDRMRQIFREYDLPEELTALPHVESSFNWSAYSHLGAAGVWQFTRRTGRLFLRINYEVDERFDPLRSTEAAAQLLKKSYEELGTWPLAITAYNHGLAGMKRAVRILRTTDFDVIVRRYRSRSFKFASKNFYAEFLAALFVRTHYRKFFGEVEFEPPLDFVEFELPDYVSATDLAKYFGVSLEELRKLNPALRSPVWRGHRRIPRGFVLRLPADLPTSPDALYASLPEQARYDKQVRPRTYRVRRGENLSLIARKLGVPLRDLIAFNDIRNPHRIREGQWLNIPPTDYRSSRPTAKLALASATKGEERGHPTVTEQPQGRERAKAQAAQGTVTVSERVALGGGAAEVHWVAYDSSWTPENNWSRSSLAERAELPSDGWIRVQPEETLGHYADWLNVPTQELRRINGLAFGQEIQVGQRLRLTFRNVTPEEFHRKRIEYLQSIEEDFFANYRVTGVRTHRVRRGENIWYLCHSVYDVPYWLMWSYNPDRDLARLHVGDELRVPIIEPVDASTPEPGAGS